MNISITIRAVQASDVDLLFEIRCSVRENLQTRVELAELGITSNSVMEMIESGDYVSFIARCDDVDAGFTMAKISERYIFACFVRPSFEGRGIGRLLMTITECELLKRGIDTAWLTTEADYSFRAVGFYRALGWTEARRLDDGQIRFEKKFNLSEQKHREQRLTRPELE